MTANQRKRRLKRIEPSVDRLYKAVQNYVEKGGGKLVAIGGVSIQQWPTDRTKVFYVAVKCVGRKPAKCHPTT